MVGQAKIVAQLRDRLGEAAMWRAGERAIYWVDWYGPTVHRLGPGDATARSWTIPGTSLLGSIAFVAGGRLLLAIDSGLALFDPRTGGLARFADPNQGREGVAYNDSKVDRHGNVWIGTFDLAETEPRGILYRVTRDGEAAVGDSGFAVTNGPAFSPDGRTLYFSDTVGRRLLAYDAHDALPLLRNRRVFASMSDDEGMPDGLTVDAAGGVWCAHYGAGRVTRFAPDGRRSAVVALPCPTITSCSFGGPEMRTLFVTSGWSAGVQRAEDEQGPGGALFAVETDYEGLPEPEFDPA